MFFVAWFSLLFRCSFAFEIPLVSLVVRLLVPGLQIVVKWRDAPVQPTRCGTDHHATEKRPAACHRVQLNGFGANSVAGVSGIYSPLLIFGPVRFGPVGEFATGPYGPVRSGRKKISTKI